MLKKNVSVRSRCRSQPWERGAKASQVRKGQRVDPECKPSFMARGYPWSGLAGSSALHEEAISEVKPQPKHALGSETSHVGVLNVASDWQLACLASLLEVLAGHCTTLVKRLIRPLVPTFPRLCHAGPQLNAQLEGWLSQVQSTKRPARAIIAPHAGYTYCGSCAAHAYKQVDPNITRKIFILGPSHHVPLSRCALSSVDIYRTPLYDLRIDQKIYGELWKTGMFERMSLQTDEDEHSIEMHLPYTAKAMESHKDEFTIIPVLVGALSESKEQEFGKLFSKYLADPSNLFVVSSDFCHWGQRFRYSYYDESQGEIYRSIEHLDKMGMSIIEQLDPVSFSNYLKKYHNTICGRHPIGVLLNAINELQKNGMNMSFSFLNYAQSSQCRNWQDSSVSYAAGALMVH
ncbi:PREDICTED: protein MEMO1 [Merops nubicus]|nr:PREDICTED: protein MEMO1 [Merops nubicus]